MLESSHPDAKKGAPMELLFASVFDNLSQDLGVLQLKIVKNLYRCVRFLYNPSVLILFGMV